MMRIRASPQFAVRSCVATCLLCLWRLLIVGLPSTVTSNTLLTTTIPAALADFTATENASLSPTPQNRHLLFYRENILPLITVSPPKDACFRIYEAVELPCRAEGIPVPDYKWTRNGAPFDPSDSDGRIAIEPGSGTLIFARPIERDEAYYQCSAYNIAGTAFSDKVDLRMGVLWPFASKATKRNYPQIGSSLTLSCAPPTSFPRAKIYWATNTSDHGFSPINYTDRVTQDPIGNLHFVNVVPEDSKYGATYACVAENRVTRGIQRGEFNTIATYEVHPELHSPEVLWHPPTQQYALRGQTWSVKCIFSGSPTPWVTWRRIDKEMPDRHRYESFGQQLNIDNVQFEDAGTYECQAINDNTMVPVRRSIDLCVESAPYFIEKPVSQDVAENGTATFRCRGTGVPEPAIRWLINGVRVTKMEADPQRIGGLLYDLTFVNVTTEDGPKMVQCNITNKHGYNFTEAYLNVYSTILSPSDISVDSVRPSYGPVAGGTRVTITGQYVSLTTVTAVHFGQHQGFIDKHSFQEDTVIATTPPVTETARHLAIKLVLSDGSQIDTDRTFEYRKNPVFTGIGPSNHLTVGGTEVTVYGSHLDSVAKPRITLTVVTTRVHNDRSLTSESGPCEYQKSKPDGTEMTCRMPVVNLPDDLQQQLENDSETINNTESPGVAVYFSTDGNTRADIYIGLQLDGFTLYQDISSVNPNIKMQFSPEPEVNCTSDYVDFHPNHGTVIAIKGRHFQRGSRPVDFDIRLGVSLCVVYSLSDDQVECRPPTSRPDKNVNDTLFCQNDTLSLQMRIGNAAYQCSCLRYVTQENIPLIVGLSVALSLLLIIIIIFTVVVLYCRRHGKQPTQGQVPENYQQITMEQDYQESQYSKREWRI